MTTMTAIVDLQFGSTGKGLIAGYLSERKPFDTVVSANMPNAGHTFVDANGRKWINKVLPSGLYSNALRNVCIGPGAIFNPYQLIHEIHEMRQRTTSRPRIVIHECAALVHPYHAAIESGELSKIASTMQGSAEAMIEKIKRQPEGNNIVRDNREFLDGIITNEDEPLSQFIVRGDVWNDLMINSEHILVEGSQGYSLGINAGFYPFCTSRDCTIGRLLSDCAIPVVSNRTIIGCARTYPIRVGHTEDGNSGPHYPDQEEISWDDLGVKPEYTTVTGRQRRVFTFSEKQVREAIFANGVDQVFLNFCNYNPIEAVRIINAINQIGSISYKYRGFGAWEGELPQLVRYMGFGPQSSHILEYAGYTP